jgi:hypothetical protein
MHVLDDFEVRSLFSWGSSSIVHAGRTTPMELPIDYAAGPGKVATVARSIDE